MQPPPPDAKPTVDARGRPMSRRHRPRSSAWAALITLAVAAAVCRAAQVVVVNGNVVNANAAEEEKHDGFSIRKEAGKFNDALEDFARYRDKKAWELAFRSLETLGEAKRDGMVPAGNGFFVPSRQRVLASLTSLPPEGKQAFRLFYDAKARQLLERAEGASKTTAGAGSGTAATPSASS